MTVEIDIIKLEQKINENLTIEELATFFNCSRGTISNRLDKFNLHIKRYKYCPCCNKKFKTLKAIRSHLGSCERYNGEYYIDLNIGAIHYKEFINKSLVDIAKMNLAQDYGKIRDIFKERGFVISSKHKKWTLISFKEAVEEFVNLNKRTPACSDTYGNLDLPSYNWVINNFESWNKGMIFCGFDPNFSKLYGNPTKALDDKIYRSKLEANFVDKFLFNKYNYISEIKYDSPHNKHRYDFYIKELDLYIEIFGITNNIKYNEKIKFKKEVNQKLNKNFLAVYPKDIYNKNLIEELKI